MVTDEIGHSVKIRFAEDKHGLRFGSSYWWLKTSVCRKLFTVLTNVP